MAQRQQAHRPIKITPAHVSFVCAISSGSVTFTPPFFFLLPLVFSLTPLSNTATKPAKPFRTGLESFISLMDVLFNTINVRDLLSATDLNDPTTPLSVPDLRLLIQKLDSHSQSIKLQVQSYLLSHHSDFSSLFSLCSDAVSQTDAISSNLSDILSLISSDSNDRPIDIEIREVVGEIARKLKEVRVSKELLGLVRVVWSLSERLNGVKEGLRNGELNVAQEIRDLKAAVRICDEEERDGTDREPVVYGLLKKEWNQCFEEVVDNFTRLI